MIFSDIPPVVLTAVGDYYKFDVYEDIKRSFADVQGSETDGENESKEFHKLVLSCFSSTDEEKQLNVPVDSTLNLLVSKVVEEPTQLKDEFSCERRYAPSIESSSIDRDNFIVPPSDDLVIHRSGYRVREMIGIDRPTCIYTYSNGLI